MKKIICSVLLGSFIGAAFGVPTPEDRKAFCEKYPDKYVWVQKTEACLPINPCEADDSTIYYTYCVFAYNFGSDMTYERYIKNVLKTGVAEHRILDESTDFETFSAYKLTDGGYVVFRSFREDGEYGALSDIRAGCFAYGKHYTHPSELSYDAGVCEDADSETQCTDIADFVMLIRETFCRGKLQGDNSCLVACESIKAE